MIKGARGGGSITYDVRRQMVAAETAGNLQIIENCEVTNIQVTIAIPILYFYLLT